MSKLLRGTGTLIAIVGGLLGFVLSFIVVYEVWDGGAVLLSLLFFPVVFALVPFFTLFVFGSWNLLLINYGSVAVYMVLHQIADAMEKAPAIASALKTEVPTTDKSTLTNKPQSKFLPILLWVTAGGLILLAVFYAPSGLSATTATLTRTPNPTRPSTRVVPTLTRAPVTLNACVTNATIRIRKGPGTEFEVMGGLTSGTCVTVTGRNKDASWLYIVTDDKITGWVAASLMTVEGAVNRLTVQVASDVAQVIIQKTATSKPLRTATSRPLVLASSTPRSVNQGVQLCSELGSKIGERVTCKVPRAYCDYLPDVNGNPTFCNDRPYPDQNFQIVVWEEDWSDLGGSCLVVSGYIGIYRGVLQIEVTSRSQVSDCN
jgi:uncharacterized protein YgiM (DUF1202 family)